jgi:hypothetical protein
MKSTLLEAFERWKGALIDLDKQTTQAARHRAHTRVTNMEDLIAETPADDIEGVGIKLALYVHMNERGFERRKPARRPLPPSPHSTLGEI